MRMFYRFLTLIAMIVMSQTAVLAVVDAPGRSGSRNSAVTQEARDLGFVPNEIVVTFREDSKIGSVADLMFQNRQSFRSLTGDTNLDNLLKRFKIRNIETLYEDIANTKRSFSRTRWFSKNIAQRVENQIRRHESRILERVRNRVNLNQKQGLKTDLPSFRNTYIMKLAKDVNLQEAIRQLQNDPNVKNAHPNYVMTVQLDSFGTPNDPRYDELWGIHKISADVAWGASQGEGIIAAVVDTGVDRNHPDIKNNMWINTNESSNGKDDDNNGYIDDTWGWNAINNNNNPMDGHFHGTHCAGTIAATGNNGVGVIGVAPKAKIMAAKGLDDSGSGSFESLANAMRYAIVNGAHVVNNSWGCNGSCPEPDQMFEDLFDLAEETGTVLIFAAGNNNGDVGKLYPQNSSRTISVSATDINDKKASFSNWGDLINVAAPGVDVLSLDLNNGYRTASGTSMACPHTVGVAALIMSNKPNFTPVQVKEVLQRSADDILAPGFDTDSGHGRINAAKAVNIDNILEVAIHKPERQTFYEHGKSNVKLPVVVTAKGKGFDHFSIAERNLEVPGADWKAIYGPDRSQADNEQVMTWDISRLSPGAHGLLLTALSKDDIEFSSSTSILIGREVTELTPKNLSIKSYDISGELVAITSNRDVHVLDLATMQLKNLNVSGNPNQARISGNLIVWLDGDSNSLNKKLRMYNYASGQQKVLKEGIILAADVAGQFVTWNTSSEVILHDTAKGTEKVIATVNSGSFFTSSIGKVSASEKYIAWDASSFRESYIEAYSLSNGEVKKAPGTARNPRLFGNFLLYEKSTSPFGFRWGGFELAFHNLDTGKDEKFPEAVDPVSAFPAGDRIVYEDKSAGNKDIALYDKKTQQNHRVTFHPADQTRPELSGNNLVWIDQRGGSLQMYHFDISKLNLPPDTLRASATASPLSGEAPLNVQFSVSASGGTGNYSYSWAFGDGGTSSAVRPSHTYQSPGSYTARVTVRDGKTSVSDSLVITVKEKPAPPPPPPDDDPDDPGDDPGDGRDAYKTIQAASYDKSSGFAFDRNGSIWLSFNSWLAFEKVNFQGGAAKVEVTAGSFTGSTLEVRLGSPTGTLLGSITITRTSFRTEKKFQSNVKAISGTHDVYIINKTGSPTLRDIRFMK